MTVTRTYDAANRLTDVLDWSNHDTHFGYDANGNLTSETLPTTNPTTSTLTYDTADQLTRIVTARTAGSTPFRWTFGYGRDPLGQVSASTDRMEGMRHSYGYDALNRLTSDTRSNRTKTSWGYDAADNLKTQVESGSGLTKTFTYDTNNSELTSLQLSGSSSQSLTFGYNANGDRTSTSGGANPISYGYNQADQLTSYSQGSTTASYAYDGDGLRTSKTVNGTSEGYVWNLAEGMPTILQDGSTRYITGPDGLPIEQVDGSGTVSYYIQDQLGSTRGLLDASGTVVGSSTYTPYGEVKGHSGASTPFGYAGQYTDSESGLQYLRARYYDPSTQQFLTVDPLLSSTMEPYGYAGGNGLNASDPSGMCGWVPAVPCPGDVAAAVVHGAGWVKNNPGPALFWGGYSVVTAGAAICAIATLGVCLAPEAALAGGVLASGALYVEENGGPASEVTGADLEASSCEGLTQAVQRGPIPDMTGGNLTEQLAIKEAQSGYGRRIMRVMDDTPRLIANYGTGNWVKMQWVHNGPGGVRVTVHWFRNLTTGLNKEFKVVFSRGINFPAKS